MLASRARRGPAPSYVAKCAAATGSAQRRPWVAAISAALRLRSRAAVSARLPAAAAALHTSARHCTAAGSKDSAARAPAFHHTSARPVAGWSFAASADRAASVDLHVAAAWSDSADIQLSSAGAADADGGTVPSIVVREDAEEGVLSVNVTAPPHSECAGTVGDALDGLIGGPSQHARALCVALPAQPCAEVDIRWGCGEVRLAARGAGQGSGGGDGSGGGAGKLEAAAGVLVTTAASQAGLGGGNITIGKLRTAALVLEAGVPPAPSPRRAGVVSAGATASSPGGDTPYCGDIEVQSLLEASELTARCRRFVAQKLVVGTATVLAASSIDVGSAYGSEITFCSTGLGAVRVGAAHGSLVARTASGTVHVGGVTGSATVTAAGGGGVTVHFDRLLPGTASVVTAEDGPVRITLLAPVEVLLRVVTASGSTDGADAYADVAAHGGAGGISVKPGFTGSLAHMTDAAFAIAATAAVGAQGMAAADSSAQHAPALSVAREGVGVSVCGLLRARQDAPPMVENEKGTWSPQAAAARTAARSTGGGGGGGAGLSADGSGKIRGGGALGPGGAATPPPSDAGYFFTIGGGRLQPVERGAHAPAVLTVVARGGASAGVLVEIISWWELVQRRGMERAKARVGGERAGE
jgi:hypothetical protein